MRSATAIAWRPPLPLSPMAAKVRRSVRLIHASGSRWLSGAGRGSRSSRRQQRLRTAEACTHYLFPITSSPLQTHISVATAPTGDDVVGEAADAVDLPEVVASPA